MDSTIQEFLDFMLYQRRSSPLTIKTYATDLRLFSQFLDENSLGSPVNATSKIVRRWLVSLLDAGDQPRSVNRKIATLRSYFRYLCSVGKVKVNPCRAIDALKTPHKLPVFLHEDEAKLMLDSANFPDDFKGQRDRTIIQTLYLTGIRVSELICLTIRSIDFALDQLTVLGKRNKQRIIPLTPTLKSILISYLHLREQEFGEAKPDDRLFLSQKGDMPLYEQMVYRIVAAHIETVANTAMKGPHVMRHTFATALLNNGADLMAIKELLGHSSLAATQVYAHSDFEQLNKIYKLAHPRADN
ncbi:MAG: tyrosine-type recombinase/integrase [Bacteroidales bacterium]|nr:tyrosine-type recombinase/integrase [Bacteroidales bacterium]